MDPLSAAVAIKALDGLTARANVTAENIANASTPGYRPRQVTFEQALTEAAKRGPGAVRGVTPMIGQSASVASGDGGPRLDLDMANASTTASRYGALIEVLNRQLQLEDLALTDIR
jgi:flagellar basal-body rod protein FlgB